MGTRRIIQSSYDLALAAAATEVGTLTAQAGLVAAPKAITGDAVVGTIPAGGTGASAGGWDTAGNRDAAIATLTDALVVIAELIVDVTALRATQAAILVSLKAAGLM